MKAIIPILKRLTKEKIVLELQIKKLLKIYGTQYPKSFHHFQLINNRFISHCAHIYLTISVILNHAGTTVIEQAPYLCFEFGPVLVWY
jgi:hypothetical protein